MILTMVALACVDGGSKEDDSEPYSPPLFWYEDPCGRRDPLERECPKGVKTVEVGTDPTCADAGIKPGDSCDDAGTTCIQLRPIACEDDPKKIIASDAVLTCGTEPPDDLCPESSRTVKTAEKKATPIPVAIEVSHGVRNRGCTRLTNGGRSPSRAML